MLVNLADLHVIANVQVFNLQLTLISSFAVNINNNPRKQLKSASNKFLLQ